MVLGENCILVIFKHFHYLILILKTNKSEEHDDATKQRVGQEHADCVGVFDTWLMRGGIQLLKQEKEKEA